MEPLELAEALREHEVVLWAFLGIALLVALYFWPAMTAIKRRHPAVGGVVLLNVLLGWTAIGWVAALIWSYSEGESPRARRVAKKARVSPERWLKDPPVVVIAAAGHCTRCGRATSAGDTFCGGCGAALAPSLVAPTNGS